MKAKKALSMVVLFCLLFSSIVMGFANDEQKIQGEIEGRRESLTIAEQEQKEVEAQLKEKELAESEIIDKIESLEMDIIEKEEEIEKIENEVKETKERISETEEELGMANEEIKGTNGTLEKRVDVMYRQGSVGYLEVLLTSANFVELLTNIDMIKKITDHDVNLIEELEKQQSLIESKKTQLEMQEAQLQMLINNIATEKESLQVSRGTQLTLRNEVQHVIATMENDLEILEVEANDTALEIQRLQKEQAEIIAERKAREEEERRQAEERRLKEEAERKAAEERAAEQRAAEQRAIERSAAERRAEEQRAAEQKAAEERAAEERAAEQKSKEETKEEPTPSYGKPSWPVPGYSRISSPFGWRTHPIYGGTRYHQGIDIPAAMGTPIVAAESGIVLMSGWRGTYGNMVSIDHGDGLATLYAHNSSNVVSVGDYVEKGQIIARIGSTGNSTGPHLHFEVMIHSERIDPRAWLNGN